MWIVRIAVVAYLSSQTINLCDDSKDINTSESVLKTNLECSRILKQSVTLEI
jgi:hypothetical protein